jgi:hypothetical protein
LEANVHTEKAIETLVDIGNNTSGISMICDFDIRGTITKFKKRQLEARPRNEVDMIAEKMNSPEQHTDAELWDMILKLQDIDMGGYDERTVLIHACIKNHFVLAKRLVEFGADVNKKDWFEKTRTRGMKIGATYISAAVYGMIEKHLRKNSKPSLRDYQRCINEITKIISVQLTQQNEAEQPNLQEEDKA